LLALGALSTEAASIKIVMPQFENAVHAVQRASVAPIAGWVWRARLSGLSRLRTEVEVL
jgi:hypothetical protein